MAKTIPGAGTRTRKPKGSENGTKTKKPREKPAKQRPLPLPGHEPEAADAVLDPLAISYYDKVVERLGIQAEEKELKGRLEFAMEQKGKLYYQASDGTEVEYPAAERKLKVKRKKDGDHPLDASGPGDEFDEAAADEFSEV